ncbi:MAG: DNA polymerase III subunit alpha [Desulfobacterales bacterium]
MVPLTVHSYYSLMWGTCSPEKICAAAKQRGYRRLAITDTDNLYGLWPFLKHCEHEDVTPIVGAEVTDPSNGYRAVCLVENDQGYQNLCRLLTRRHMDPRFDLKTVIPSYAKGLVIVTPHPDLLIPWHETGLTVAGMVSGKPNGTAFELRKTSRYLGVPLVAVPGSFFTDPDDFKIHRLLRAIDLNTSLSRLKPEDTASPDAWLAPAAEYAERFAAWPDVLRATEAIAERLTFTGPCHGSVLPPWIDAPKNSASSPASSPEGFQAGGRINPQSNNPDQTLRNAAYKGAKKRYGDDLSEAVVERMEHELHMIQKMGFSSYFLVVQDIVSRSPRICGRGSGAASLVAYSLGITNVCPIKHNLYFERFLNPGRLDPPDIDVDFAWDERDAVLQSVLNQYKGHAALISNHVFFQPRMAIRETAKVFGLTEREINRVTKRLPWFWKTDYPEEDFFQWFKRLPGLSNFEFPSPWPEIIRIARHIIGVPRYISVHPGGVVITPDPVAHYVPVELAPKGVPIIQWEKDAAEMSGLVKIDLLGNRSLAVIRDAISNLRENGTKFDEAFWEPEDDMATQASVAKGNTMGCFYIESPAMRMLQKKTKTGDFNHLVINSSIIRPAANEFIREYIRRLHGGTWKPVHPLLADVLEETYGIMVYQEDVSKAAVALAGFSHVDADGLRKIMSKKDKVRKLDDYKAHFVAGAQAKGVRMDQIEALWNMMMSFSGYSFCKPHSASYARVSFQAAYLKTHYPAEFMAAVITNQGGFYSTFAYVSEARRMGVKILPPDVNQSDIRWKGAAGTIRAGLSSVKNIRSETCNRIVTYRKGKPYRDIVDFLDRIGPDETEARSLINAGAFDLLHPKEDRAALLWEVIYRQTSGSRRSGAGDLFKERTAVSKPKFPAEKHLSRLRKEFEALGFLCDRHPMVLYAGMLQKLQIVKAVDLDHFIGRHVRVAGLLITGKVVHTKLGDPMEFLTFEDDTGLIETVFFPKAYRRFCAVLDRSRPFVLHGKVEVDFDAVSLSVTRVEPLEVRSREHGA